MRDIVKIGEGGIQMARFIQVGDICLPILAKGRPRWIPMIIICAFGIGLSIGAFILLR